MTSQTTPRSILSSVLTVGLVLTLLHLPQTGHALTADSLTTPASLAQGNDADEHATGRCKDKEKDPDKEKNKCPPDGGSSGVAKGDFNGDNFADLAIGVPREDIGGFVDAGAVHIIYGTENGLSSTGTIFGDQLITADLLTTLEQNNFFGTSLAAGNFDGDNFSDLAIGIHGDARNNQANAGEVHVLYGSASGLTEARGQIFGQGVAGLSDTAEAGDRFGQVLSWGNFNGDDFGDLAVGLPNEDIGIIADAGAVQLIYGSGTGLTPTGNQVFSQNSVLNGVEIRDTSEANDQFGRALSGGDFNGDGNSDLAIGVPEEDLPGSRTSLVDAGAVNVLYGTGSGLTSVFNQFWTQDDFDNLEFAESFDRFGSAVAAGDFNRDGAADLAIGVPFEDVQVISGGQLVEVANAGAVNVIYGSIPDGGLTTTGFQFWTQATAFVNDEAEEDDRFGSVLAAANFGTGHRTTAPSVHFDLAIGIPFEDVGNVVNAGAV